MIHVTENWSQAQLHHGPCPAAVRVFLVTDAASQREAERAVPAKGHGHPRYPELVAGTPIAAPLAAQGTYAVGVCYSADAKATLGFVSHPVRPGWFVSSPQ